MDGLLWKSLLVLGILLFGSIVTISTKIGHDTCSTGIDSLNWADATDAAHLGCTNPQRCFYKPWTQTVVAFAGEMMCLVYFASRCATRTSQPKREEALLDEHSKYSRTDSMRSPLGSTSYSTSRAGNEGASIGCWECFICWLPACCDLGGRALSGVGLLFTTASAFQMLRGSLMVFTGICSVVFLKTPLPCFKWVALLITVLGITVVGISSYIDGGQSNSSSATGRMASLGIALVVISQLCSALQMVIEENFVKRRDLPPEFVVGCEGCFGLLMMLGMVLPVSYYIPFGSPCTETWCKDGGGVHENALDAIMLLSNNTWLLFVFLLYWVSVPFYKFCGIFVSKRLSAVHRTLFEASCTMLVWGVELGLYHMSDGKYGEKWRGTAALVQLGGFAVMLVGIFIYNEIPFFKLPGGATLGYEEEEVPFYLQSSRDGPDWNYKEAAGLRENIRNGAHAGNSHTAM